MRFDELFRRATQSECLPYPYQVQFATAPELPQLLRVPTGAGKTATAILGWLYRRRFHPSPAVRAATPRRLVYCLPMRTLVEQTVRCATDWLTALELLAPAGSHATDAQLAESHVVLATLMGGTDPGDWQLEVARDAVLIGTQDMLLSRALNRGYAASRFHWPVDFALLNNDCLWVYDEPQLMANGVTTSAQLAGLRESLQTIGPCQSLWMSATLEPQWLQTVDFPDVTSRPILGLGTFETGNDLDPDRPLYRRMTADKTLRRLESPFNSDMKAVAQATLAAHVSGTQTLLIVNTVERAKAACKALNDLCRKQRSSPLKTLLIHSRFRPADRASRNAALQDPAQAPDRIVVATQVVEAGVDLSARTLITELAPWSSLVQRFGRCNRTGHDGPGQIVWLDLPEKHAAPYTPEELHLARGWLTQCEGRSVSPQALEDFKTANNIVLPFEASHVLRRRDVLDLFDTTPDLSGMDLDVQRFIRTDEDSRDVHVFWRESIPESAAERRDLPAAGKNELCPVPLKGLREFLKARRGDVTALVWDFLDEVWREVRDPDRDPDLRPGQMLLIPATAGGYSEFGWDPDSKTPVACVPPNDAPPAEGTGSDPLSRTSTPVTLALHTRHVCEELSELLQHVPELPALLDGVDPHVTLQTAALWHDVGKAHEQFQLRLRSLNPDLTLDELWAKSGRKGRAASPHLRKAFRHELVSALAALDHGVPFAAAYLVATHHGRVRLGIRPLPDETLPAEPDRPYALGVHEGDPLPAIALPNLQIPAKTLSLAPMFLGGPTSWTGQALELLARLGPFRLALFEALIRIADCRASRKEAQT